MHTLTLTLLAALIGVAGEPSRPGPGYVDEDTIDELWHLTDDVPEASRHASLADWAAALLEDDETVYPPDGIFATRGDAVAVISEDFVGSCGHGSDRSMGWIATRRAPKPKARRKLFSGPDRETTFEPTVAGEWMAGLARDGFVLAPSIALAASGGQGEGMRTVVSTVILGRPLARWFIQVAYHRNGDNTLWLVSPDNQRRHRLGVIAKQYNAYCRGAERRSGECDDYVDLSITSAVMSQDASTLFVFADLGDTAHCGVSQHFVRGFRLPKGVKLVW